MNLNDDKKKPSLSLTTVCRPPTCKGTSLFSSALPFVAMSMSSSISFVLKRSSHQSRSHSNFEMERFCAPKRCFMRHASRAVSLPSPRVESDRKTAESADLRMALMPCSTPSFKPKRQVKSTSAHHVESVNCRATSDAPRSPDHPLATGPTQRVQGDALQDNQHEVLFEDKAESPHTEPVAQTVLEGHLFHQSGPVLRFGVVREQVGRSQQGHPRSSILSEEDQPGTATTEVQDTNTFTAEKWDFIPVNEAAHRDNERNDETDQIPKSWSWLKSHRGHGTLCVELRCCL